MSQSHQTSIKLRLRYLLWQPLLLFVRSRKRGVPRRPRWHASWLVSPQVFRQKCARVPTCKRITFMESGN